jgi:hypothetical protein
MSLVIASNQDQDQTARQEQSIYSSWSFKNDLSAVYNIPANSQVCLQSAKVNLDGRLTISGNNGIYYDWYGEELSIGDEDQVNTTSYPITQDFGTAGRVEEYTADELAERVKNQHREYHPNRKSLFDCQVKRNAGLDFLGFDFTYGFNGSQNASTKPSSFEPFANVNESDDIVFSWTQATGVFQRSASTVEPAPCVGIGLGYPLDLSNGSMQVDFSNANGSAVEWAVGLTRDIPVPQQHEYGDHAPAYYSQTNACEATLLLDNQQFFCDFCAHRNASNELVLTHAVMNSDLSGRLTRKEVAYWTNTDSDLTGGGRYDLANNSGGYDKIIFTVDGEKVKVEIGHAGSTDLVTEFSASQPKTSYLKPVSQTNWCLHPLLFVGTDGVSASNTLTMESYSGMNITGYNSREVYNGGWYETSSLLGSNGNVENALANCRTVETLRSFPQDPTFDDTRYTQVGLNASNMVDYTPAMITAPNEDYYFTENAGVSRLFGFIGRSLVNAGTFGGVQGRDITFSSDEAPPLTTTQSIFIRLNGFGQQVLNARTGNRSTILAHLPTADGNVTSDSSGRVFYEPNRDVWLDLNNAYDIKTSDFSIDFVYSNEQYSKILQGQSIVVLYFREKP